MDNNPYETPNLSEQVNRGWRKRWMYACIGSLFIAAVCFVAAQILSGLATKPPTRGVLIADGVIALGELGGIVVAGICGIGWVVSRR